MLRVIQLFFLLGKPAVLGLLVFFASGCVAKKLEQRIKAASKEVFRDQIAYSENAEAAAVSISWDSAVQIMKERNTQLNRAKVALQDLEQERNQFALRQLSPRLSAVANLTTALANVAAVDSDSVGLQLLGTIQIPDPFTTYAQRYSLELQYYITTLNYEQLVRQSHASLYETFLTQAEIDRENRETLKKLPTAGSQAATREIARQLNQEDERRKLEIQRRKRTLQRRINFLLNSPKQRFYLKYDTLPELHYKERYQKLSFRDGFGMLALKQTAGEIESARADLWRVKANRFPPLNVNVSLPSIFDSRTDDSPELNDIQLFSSSSKTFEFAGQEARSIRSAEQRAKDTRDRIQLNLSDEAYNFAQLKLRYSSFLRSEERLSRQLEYYRKNPPLPSASLISERAEEKQQLRKELADFRSFRRRLELEFWIWDENHWKSPF